MKQPEALKKNEPLVWSTGTGTEVWALFCACIDGDFQKVKTLLDANAALARCHYNYRKPIYFAVRENRLDVAALLIERDPDPIGLAVNDSLLEIARDRGYAEMENLISRKFEERRISARGEPAAAAIRQRDLPGLRALLDSSPALLEMGDLRGNRPIHWAALTRQVDIIDELIERGADSNAARPDGARPVQLTNGDYHFRNWWNGEDKPSPRDVILHLCSRGAYLDLVTACHIGDMDRIRELLDGDPALVNKPSFYSYYACSGVPIRNAAAAGHIEIVKLLLERGADPNVPEEGVAPRGHAVYAAAVKGHYEIVKLLLEHGGYPNAEVESSADTISRVMSNGDQKMLELLWSYGGARPVHLLAAFNDLETAAAVFAANPKLADDPEAFANAASDGHEAFVRLMLRYQPDLPKRVTFPGWAPSAKTRELNELLFARGMRPSEGDWLGITPLHEFARKGDIEKAALFLDHGANIEARDEDICSRPLAWAAKFGQKAMVEFLLQRGARKTVADDPVWATPLAWAERRGHREIANLLR
jgi:ankyrin repeat protein